MSKKKLATDRSFKIFLIYFLLFIFVCTGDDVRWPLPCGGCVDRSHDTPVFASHWSRCCLGGGRGVKVPNKEGFGWQFGTIFELHQALTLFVAIPSRSNSEDWRNNRGSSSSSSSRSRSVEEEWITAAETGKVLCQWDQEHWELLLCELGHPGWPLIPLESAAFFPLVLRRERKRDPALEIVLGGSDS